MPYTPLHLGVGGLAKALVPTRVSLAAFAASQVAIDLEPGYYLLAGHWPVHRWAHRLVVAAPLGLAVGAGVWLIARAVAGRLPESWRRSPETALAPALVGGLLGGVTHPLLDALMHWDVVPFWPAVAGNPLLGLVSVRALHLLCLGAGLLAGVVWMARRPAAQATRRPPASTR